ncbi:hypothetical protein HBI81_010130 [Parastagonospora nodorum]|nr:hypothetical protein HBH52_142670 [Parastagonospora nodorum]KAH4004138.1 hypothetical protein HBI10_049580 [Parastagonospora nodorum]KAH4018501.1 hypothetical protein HBI13_133540 [Parastagonospora nodorum]KAH4072080.1 hypothetical protein HBH50_072320 [Parastagonospora nodorum]KAH4094964.1 hypothetical protein HBH48_060580 [Parastagonospora nodorum]
MPVRVWLLMAVLSLVVLASLAPASSSLPLGFSASDNVLSFSRYPFLSHIASMHHTPSPQGKYGGHVVAVRFPSYDGYSLAVRCRLASSTTPGLITPNRIVDHKMEHF